MELTGCLPGASPGVVQVSGSMNFQSAYCMQTNVEADNHSSVGAAAEAGVVFPFCDTVFYDAGRTFVGY